MLLPVSSHFFHVHRMAQNEPEHTLPVFMQNNSLPAFDKKDFSTAEICSYAEKTTHTHTHTHTLYRLIGVKDNVA